MEKIYEHKKIEKEMSSLWENSGCFKAVRDPSKKPYTIVLPPPNASGKMHTGNVLMIAIEDLLIRWKRMKGYSALWLPGTDHAGFETQITFERELSKKGKSRFDYDRSTLYQMIWDFVHENKGLIENQIKNMGASVDWSRYTFTLDEKVVNTVYETFKKMYNDGLLERRDYIVNYCPKCGTTFADLELDYIDRADPLYYIRYPFADNENEFITVATVRPETIFADMWLAVNPKDKKKQKYVGRKILNPLTREELTIISDSFVDPKFGTGVVKITPAHDKNDYEVGLRQKVKNIKVAINWEARLTSDCVIKKKNGESESLAGINVKEARKMTMEYLTEAGYVERVDDKYEHTVSVCYKGNHEIEPVVMPNWFVKVETLKKPALDVVKKGKVKIFPKWREKTYTRWMEDMRDWPISRQVVWGIRIPVWYEVILGDSSLIVSYVDSNGKQHSGPVSKFLSEGVELTEIEQGLQRLYAMSGAIHKISAEKPNDGKQYLPETDTFDTWFSSGQWPLVTLGYPDSEDFNYFYPTAVLETGWEIIRLWVSRMIMFGMYLTKDKKLAGDFEGFGTPPFSHVYLHGMVRAIDGRKMSKSLGNVINPDEYQEQYGTDALRMGLISGTANGKDFAFPRDKVIGYRNFSNKIWNMARFMHMLMEEYKQLKGVEVSWFNEKNMKKSLNEEDKTLLKGLKTLVKTVDKNLEKYRFADAGDAIYQFMWHEIADKYIELVKQREEKETGLSALRYVYLNCLKLLHPFMPFVTEAIWQSFSGRGEDILASSEWPKE